MSTPAPDLWVWPVTRKDCPEGQECAACGGRGEVYRTTRRCFSNPEGVLSARCGTCGGSGWVA
jgi:DnaJ-class molecular chaperone